MDKAKLLEYADLCKICNTYTGSCLRSKHLSYAEFFVHPGQMQAKFSTTVAGLSPLTCSMYNEVTAAKKTRKLVNPLY